MTRAQEKREEGRGGRERDRDRERWGRREKERGRRERERWGREGGGKEKRKEGNKWGGRGREGGRETTTGEEKGIEGTDRKAEDETATATVAAAKEAEGRGRGGGADRPACTVIKRYRVYLCAGMWVCNLAGVLNRQIDESDRWMAFERRTGIDLRKTDRDLDRRAK